VQSWMPGALFLSPKANHEHPAPFHFPAAGKLPLESLNAPALSLPRSHDMTLKHCPACRAEVAGDLKRCPNCAALLHTPPEPPPPMTDDSASLPVSSPNLTKLGMGAGNVEVEYHASHTTTNIITHNYASPSPPPPEAKSVHVDSKANPQNTMHHSGLPPAPSSGPPPVHHSGLPPVVLFSTLCVVIGGFVLFRLADHPQESKSNSGSPAPAPAPLPAPAPAPLPAPAPAPAPAPLPDTPARPVIEAAEVGIVSQNRFIPRTDFKTNDLLTLRLRVSRDCHLRVIYQQAKGDPVRMFPEADGGSDLVRGGTVLCIPDPDKLATHAADATAFQLYHDIGSGPPIHEQIIVQIAEEPFTTDGTTRSADSPYRVFQGISLADARMRGVLKLQGLSASQAQAHMDTLLSERTLPFSIRP
jgi:hypothetical protein